MTPEINNKSFYKRLLRISLPMAFQSLMLSLVAAGDALMLGRVAQEEMTAVSLAAQVQFVQNMFLFSVTAACSILGAQYYGKGDRATLRELYSITVRYCGIVSLAFLLACEFMPDRLMLLFTADARLVEIGAEYLKIAGWSYLITGFSQSALSIMKVTEHALAGAIVSSSAVISNIALNAVFIFGLLGAPAMRFRGAALATAIARIIELLLCIVLSFRRDYVRPSFVKLFKGSKQLAADFARQCLPLLGGGLLWGVGFTSYTAIIGHIGSDAAAANSVSAVVRDIICCACNGVGNAAGIIVGNELGAGNLELGQAYGIKLKNISWVLGFASCALVLALTPLVTRFVILSDEARGYLTGMMVIMAVYMIGRCVNTVAITGVLDGGGDTVFDMYSLAVSMWGIAIPIALLGAFVFRWHVLVVYACTCLDEVGKLPWVMLRMRKYKWVRDLTRDKQ